MKNIVYVDLEGHLFLPRALSVHTLLPRPRRVRPEFADVLSGPVSPLFLVLSMILWPLALVCSAQAPSSPSSPVADEPKYEKRWLGTLLLPLCMARASRCRAGADTLRCVTMSGVGRTDKPRGACPCHQVGSAFAEAVTIVVMVKRYQSRNRLVRSGSV